MEIQFELLNETPGALRYVEIDKDGTPLVSDADGARIGNLYLRKAARKDAKPAKRIVVTIEEK